MSMQVNHFIHKIKKIVIQNRVQVPLNITSNYHVAKKLNESLTNTYAWLLVVEYCSDIRTVTPNISQLINSITKLLLVHINSA